VLALELGWKFEFVVKTGWCWVSRATSGICIIAFNKCSIIYAESDIVHR
jgi:hypothetical protein